MSKASKTRLSILTKAFELIYKKGYQSTSIDEIIASTEVTKGAFYYHFKNKEEMGVALIREIMAPGMKKHMTTPLLAASDAKTEIYQMMKGLLMDTEMFDVRYGCPAVNLIEEMAPLNEMFKNELHQIMNNWADAIAATLEQGKASMNIKQETDTNGAALFILSGYNGIRNIGKISGFSAYQSYLTSFKSYLETL